MDTTSQMIHDAIWKRLTYQSARRYAKSKTMEAYLDFTKKLSASQKISSMTRVELARAYLEDASVIRNERPGGFLPYADIWALSSNRISIIIHYKNDEYVVESEKFGEYSGYSEKIINGLMKLHKKGKLIDLLNLKFLL